MPNNQEELIIKEMDDNVQVHIPIASGQNPGIASFDPEDFRVTPEGRVISLVKINAREINEKLIDLEKDKAEKSDVEEAFTKETQERKDADAKETQERKNADTKETQERKDADTGIKEDLTILTDRVDNLLPKTEGLLYNDVMGKIQAAGVKLKQVNTDSFEITTPDSLSFVGQRIYTKTTNWSGIESAPPSSNYITYVSVSKNLTQMACQDVTNRAKSNTITVQPDQINLNIEVDPENLAIPGTQTVRLTRDGFTRNGKEIATLNQIEEARNALQAKIDELTELVELAKMIAEGRAGAEIFKTEAEMWAWLDNPANIAKITKGWNFLIEEKYVPDYWWNGTEAIEGETKFIDLTPYYKATEVDDLLKSKLNMYGFPGYLTGTAEIDGKLTQVYLKYGTSALGGEIVQRDVNGNIGVPGTNMFSASAVPKWLAEQMVSERVPILEEHSTYPLAYIRTPQGNNSSMFVSSNMSALPCIVQRTGTGGITVHEIPTFDDDAASKYYVDKMTRESKEAGATHLHNFIEEDL